MAFDPEAIFKQHTAALASAESAVKRAEADRQAARKKLVGTLNWEHLSAEGRDAKEQEWFGPVAKAEEQAAETLKAAGELVEQLETFGRAEPQLEAAALERANALALFVREDVEAARGGDDVAKLIGDALNESDRPRVWLLARYARRRRDAGEPGWSTAELAAALRRAGEALADPERAKALERAKDLRAAVREARQKVREVRKEEHHQAALEHARRSGMYSSF